MLLASGGWRDRDGCAAHLRQLFWAIVCGSDAHDAGSLAARSARNRRRRLRGGVLGVRVAIGYRGYFAGRYLGKRKLYEAVSPKKTIAGSVGGLTAAVVGGVVAHFTILASLPLSHAIVLGVVAGFLGSLVISANRF